MPYNRFHLLLVLWILPVTVLEAQAPYEPPKEIFTPTPEPAPAAPAAPASESQPGESAPEMIEAPADDGQSEEPPPPPPPTPRPKVMAPPPIEAQQWRYGANGQIEWGTGGSGSPDEEQPVEQEPTATPTKPVGRTTLRAEQPKGTFLQGNYTILQSVTVRVRNQGAYDAKNVLVYARLPGSKKRHLLSGPRTLAAGSAAEYNGSAAEVVRVAGNIQIEPTCENCRN